MKEARRRHGERVSASLKLRRFMSQVKRLTRGKKFVEAATLIEKEGMNHPGYRMHRAFYLIAGGQIDRGYKILMSEARDQTVYNGRGLSVLSRRVFTDHMIKVRRSEVALELAKLAVSRTRSRSADALLAQAQAHSARAEHSLALAMLDKAIALPTPMGKPKKFQPSRHALLRLRETVLKKGSIAPRPGGISFSPTSKK